MLPTLNDPWRFFPYRRCKNGAMRYFTVVRHCESTPAGPGETDVARTLSERGRAQAAQLRGWASDANALGAYGPTTTLVSSAARTMETYRRAFDDTSFVVGMERSDLIYNGHRDVTAEDVLIDVAAIDPVTTSLAVVAHFPTVYELVATLAGDVPASMREGYPLGGAYVFALPANEQIGLATYELVAEFIPD